MRESALTPCSPPHVHGPAAAPLWAWPALLAIVLTSGLAGCCDASATERKATTAPPPIADPEALSATAVVTVDSATSDAAHTVPSWAADAVFYQIFPERFCNGDPSNDPTRESLESPDTVPTTWSEIAEDGDRLPGRHIRTRI